MGSTRGGASTPWRAMIEDSTKEFLTVLSGEGSISLISSRGRGVGASLALTTTPTLMENYPTTHHTMKVPTWTAVPRLETNPERHCSHHGGQQVQACA
jgi:hypothetical protein